MKLGEYSNSFDCNPVPAVVQTSRVSEPVEHIFADVRQLSDGDMLFDYTDRSACQSHKFSSKNRDAMRLYFYANEFEACNP